MKGCQRFLIGVLIGVVILIALVISNPVGAVALEVVLSDSAPVAQGACPYNHPRHGLLIMDCVRGQRADGSNVFAIREDGEIIAVFEQVSKDVAPRQIWGKEWTDT